MTRVTHTMVVEALQRHLGILALAAKELGLSRQALERRVSRSAALKAALHDITETRKDMCEAVVLRAIQEKSLPAAQWMLERTARDRYALRAEVTGRDGAAIDLNTTIEGLTDEQAQLLERFVQSASGKPEKP